MKYVLYIAALLVLIILQSGLIGHLGLGEVGNLLMIFVVIAVILLETKEGLILALAAGFMLDLVSGSRDGTLMICMLAVLGVSHFYVYKLVPKEPNQLLLISCVLVNTIVFALSFVIINHVFALVRLDVIFDWRYILGKKLLLDLAANLVLTYPVYLYFIFLQKIQNRLGQLLIRNY